MSVALPTDIGPRNISPQLVDFGERHDPPLGGESSYVGRLGTRWQFDVNLPPMGWGTRGRIWAARLAAGKVDGGVLMQIPQAMNIMNPGVIVKANAGSVGNLLNYRDITPNYLWLEGQWISYIVGGRRFAHMVRTADHIANGLGIGTLTVVPSIRVVIPDGAPIEVQTPMIEGMLSGNSMKWTVDEAAMTGLSFSIMEVK